MCENEHMVEAAKALGLGELAPEVYRDLLQPAARKLGESLATVAEAVKVALAPVEASIWGYEQIKQWLSFRVTRIHADRGTTQITPPPLSIAGPLVFNLIFTQEEADLKEMYASLLASAMDPGESDAHPSFVSIIQQLTSDEARILKYLAHCGEEWPQLSSNVKSPGVIEPSIERQFRDWCVQAEIADPEKSDIYLDNLVRLRILYHIVGNEASYMAGGHDAEFGPYEASISNELHEVLELTVFGRHFLNACIEKP